VSLRAREGLVAGWILLDAAGAVMFRGSLTTLAAALFAVAAIGSLDTLRRLRRQGEVSPRGRRARRTAARQRQAQLARLRAAEALAQQAGSGERGAS
jgi:hypothetical protein